MEKNQFAIPTELQLSIFFIPDCRIGDRQKSCKSKRCQSKRKKESQKKWVEDKNNSIHRSTGKKPADLYKEERLKPLPAIPWKNESIHPPVKTTKTGMMVFDTNSYSVPDYLTGKSLSIHSTPATINIYDSNKKAASHPRSFVS